MKRRKSGFYWVKLVEAWQVGMWWVFDNGVWFLCGLTNCYKDEDLKAIDERQIKRLPKMAKKKVGAKK